MLTIPTAAEFHLGSHSPYTAYKRSTLCVCVVASATKLFLLEWLYALCAGSFTQSHEFSEVCIQFRAKQLKARCMPRGFLWSQMLAFVARWKKRMISSTFLFKRSSSAPRSAFIAGTPRLT
jgi:hypothetical protein